MQLPQGAVSYGWLVRCAALWRKPLGDNQIRVLFLNIREDAEAGCRVLTEPVLLVRVQTVSAADPAELLRGAASSGYLPTPQCGIPCRRGICRGAPARRCDPFATTPVCFVGRTVREGTARCAVCCAVRNTVPSGIPCGSGAGYIG